ncbi:MAG: ribonuclease HI [Acidobacteria bacterium]|nr:ribonuclease HI [Acidobacteriota bacterium]
MKKNNIESDSPPTPVIHLYTDGACSGNPGPGGWGVVMETPGGVREYGGHEPHTTNNRMELRAAIEGLRRAPVETLVVVTDSLYVYKGIREWIHQWKRRGWQTAGGAAVLNQDLWQELDRLNAANVRWEWTRGHAGHPGNERANRIAQWFARGPRADMPPPDVPPTRPTARKKHLPLLDHRPPGVTYLSLVGGELRRHQTWEECRHRTQGCSGARYKKCRSREEEEATLAGWGFH